MSDPVARNLCGFVCLPVEAAYTEDRNVKNLQVQFEAGFLRDRFRQSGLSQLFRIKSRDIPPSKHPLHLGELHHEKKEALRLRM